MSDHSNKNLKQYIKNSGQLTKKMDKLTSQMHDKLVSKWEENFGVPLPNATQADVRVVQYDMFYSDDPSVDEYVHGAQELLQAAIGQDWPQVALASLSVVRSVAEGILGSGAISTEVHADSIRKTETDENDRDKVRTFVTAVLGVTSRASAKDWGTKKDFYVSYYAMAVWVPNEPQEVHVHKQG